MDLLGKLLIAPPSVKTGFWHKSVVFVTEHHQQGSIGLVLNKRSQVSIVEFSEQLNVTIDLPGFVYVGGPVNPKSLSILHSPEWSCSNTLEINKHYSLSSSSDMLPRLAAHDTPEYYRVFMGMAGWAPTQLVQEITGITPYKHENSWCLATPDYETVFGNDQADQWCSSLDLSGQEFAQNTCL